MAAKRVAEVLAPGAVKAAAGAMREASMMIFIVASLVRRSDSFYELEEGRILRDFDGMAYTWNQSLLRPARRLLLSTCKSLFLLLP